MALANDVGNCLGDTDALSCYIVPVSAVFLAVPFATEGGTGRGFLRDRYYFQKELRSWEFPLTHEQTERLEEMVIREFEYNGTEASIKVARNIRRGAIRPQFLDHARFEARLRIADPYAPKDLSGVLGFATGNEFAYIRAEGVKFQEIALRTLHEGTHVNRTFIDQPFFRQNLGTIVSEFTAHHAVFEFAKKRGLLHHLPEIERTESGILQKIMQSYDWTW